MSSVPGPLDSIGEARIEAPGILVVSTISIDKTYDSAEIGPHDRPRRLRRPTLCEAGPGAHEKTRNDEAVAVRTPHPRPAQTAFETSVVALWRGQSTASAGQAGTREDDRYRYRYRYTR